MRNSKPLESFIFTQRRREVQRRGGQSLRLCSSLRLCVNITSLASNIPTNKTSQSVIVILLLLVSLHSSAQPFIDEIKQFKKQDSSQFPSKNAILFVGSSSFRKWTDVQSYFPGYPIINRGFGGSSLPDVIRYAGDIIYPYHPKQVVIYCGDNDLAASDTVTGETVFTRFKILFGMIRQHLPSANIAFVSLKPSPSRLRTMKDEVIANDKIKDFISKQKNASFIDVYHKMLNPDGRPIPAIFESDSLHMNAGGYKIWQKEIQPHLIK